MQKFALALSSMDINEIGPENIMYVGPEKDVLSSAWELRKMFPKSWIYILIQLGSEWDFYEIRSPKRYNPTG